MALGMVLGRALREFTSLSRPDARIFAAGLNGLSKWDPWSSAPTQHGFSAMPAAEEPHPEPVDPKLVMSISARSDPFKTYGYMVEKLSEGHRINMKCTGTSAVHTATKTLTIGRARIKEHSMLGKDDICLRIAFQPKAPTDRISKFTIAVDRVKPELLTETGDAEDDVIKPNSRTKPKEIAMRLAVSVEEGRNPLGKAMGPVPVSMMMAGYAQMRRKLVAKGEHDLLCFPEYRTEEVRTKGEKAERVVMNFMFRRVPYDPAMDVDGTIGAGEDVPDTRKQGSKQKAEETPEGEEIVTAEETATETAPEEPAEIADDTSEATAESNSGEASSSSDETSSTDSSDAESKKE